MLDIGYYHPLVIHFAISLVLLGVLFRFVSLTGRLPFTGPAATALLLLGALAVVVATKSGEDAHIAVEAIPGIATTVHQHQVWGERTRNLAVVVALFELLALIGARSKRGRFALIASSTVGLVTALCIMQTGKLGGELVYAHAGGVGIRSGESVDVQRLLLAGLYHQAQLDERAGNADEAADLLALAGRLFPSDPAVQLLAAESLLMDRHDPAAALSALGKMVVPQNDRQLRFRYGWLTANALDALGQTARALTTLHVLQTEFPDNERLRRRLEAATTPSQQKAS
ncbi:MAG: DUF2231 domain-containing protein [Candidatus Binatia bacterium]